MADIAIQAEIPGVKSVQEELRLSARGFRSGGLSGFWFHGGGLIGRRLRPLLRI